MFNSVIAWVNGCAYGCVGVNMLASVEGGIAFAPRLGRGPNASFGVLTFILTGKRVANGVQGAMMLVGERTRKRKREGDVGLTRGAADVVSLNSLWRNLPTAGNDDFIDGASGAQS